MDASGGAPRPVPVAEIPWGDPGLVRLITPYYQMTTAVEDRAEAEPRLTDRERLVRPGRLSSSLAHEVNNPLDGLLTAGDTIHTYADRPEDFENLRLLFEPEAQSRSQVLDWLAQAEAAALAGQPAAPARQVTLNLFLNAGGRERAGRPDRCEWHQRAVDFAQHHRRRDDRS